MDNSNRVLAESWDVEAPLFDGGWIVDEGCASADNEFLAACIGRLLVLRLADYAVHHRRRGEDLLDEITEAMAYVECLELSDAEAASQRRALSALLPFDPAGLADAMLSLCWRAISEAALYSARSFAQLAYAAAVSKGLDAEAEGAARALARLATLFESPRAARRWFGRAAVHRRRCRQVRAAAL